MSFLEIDEIPLRVIQSNKLKVDPQMNIKSTPLHSNNRERAPLYFYNAGYSGKKVSFKVLIKETDQKGLISTRTMLNNWSQHGGTHTVVTDAVDVPNGDYIITDCSMEQEYLWESVWNIELMQYYVDGVDYDTKEEQLNKDTSENTSSASILTRCSKPITPGARGECVEALQRILQNNGYYLFINGKMMQIDGEYDENVVLAVSLFQADHKKTYNLTVNGIADSNTVKALINLGG